MLKFLEYLMPLLPQLLIGLVTLIIVCVRKPKIVTKDTIFEQLLILLPSFISAAEKSGLSGEVKLRNVLLSCYNFLSSMTGQDLLSLQMLYENKLTHAIEEILSTPQKKGVSTDEK